MGAGQEVMERRLDWIDYAKAIGIILVVYGHELNGLYNSGISLSDSSFFLWNSIIYSFHMPLFFFLSGVLFTSSFDRRGAKQMFLNKIDTILYPYILWSLIQGFTEFILSKFTYNSISLSNIFSLLWKPRAQFWFLYTLFFVFIINIIIFSVILKKRRLHSHFVLLLFLVAAAVYLWRPALTDYNLINRFRNNFVFFVLGILFSTYNLMQFLTSKISVILTMALFISGQWLFHGYLSLYYTDRGIESLLLSFISIFFFASLAMNLSRFSFKSLRYMGFASMTIYLMHILIGSGIRIILHKIIGIDSFFIHITIGCVTSIVFPVIALTLIRKYKIQFILSAPISSYINSK